MAGNNGKLSLKLGLGAFLARMSVPTSLAASSFLAFD
jgi:hypothetical protein